jgi:hypothetical protein
MTAIYKAQVDTPFGYYLVAVLSTEAYARGDIYNAIGTELTGIGKTVRIKGEVKKSNRRILGGLSPLKKCYTRGEQWGWISNKVK